MNNLKPHDFGRHGEVILMKVEALPENAKLVEEGQSLVVGHSETGHHHKLTIPRGTGMIKMYEVDGKTYLDFSQNAELSHQKEVEKHETQVFKPGIYIREIRESFSYAEKQMKRVQD